MSDETVAPEVPQNPPAPESAPAAPAEPTPTPEPKTVPEEPAQAPEGEGGPTFAEPVVQMGPNSQTVTLPDGSVVTTRTHPYPIDNTEWVEYERTHSGDQLRYPWKPGDAQYSANADPSIPDSHTAQRVEREIQSYADRVKSDPNAEVSPMWKGLQQVYQGELAQAIRTGGGNSEVQA